MPSIKVLIADRHTLLREALKAILGPEKDIVITGDTFTVNDAIRVISERDPDIVIMSLLRTNISGADLINEARAINPALKFIAFIDIKSNEVERALFDMKVSGLLRIDVEPDEIKRAIKTVFDGDNYIDARISDTLFEKNSKFNSELKLSFRQLQILKMIADGYTNKRISAELGISHDTVKTHVRIVLKKLKAADRAQAVSKAYELGVLKQSKSFNSDFIGWY